MALIGTDFSFPGQSSVFRGEMRDVYTIEDKIISIATDRLSVFGHLFPEPVPNKGQVSNLLTKFFAEQTKDIIPNWIESSPDPNVLIGKKCRRFNVNMVIRGALLGHAWRVYEAGSRQISGVALPEGLAEFSIFEEPLITPSTKAPAGYEEDIAGSDLVTEGMITESQYERLSIVCRQLFIKGRQHAREKGFVLADTKYEFGLYDDEIYLIDDIHTPDNSRYYDLEEYENFLEGGTRDRPQDYSKELVRQWSLSKDFSGLDDQKIPQITPEIINEMSKKYILLYEKLTGNKFDPMPNETRLDDMRQNIEISLTKIQA